MAAANGHLVVAFRADDPGNQLYVTSSTDGVTFISPAYRYQQVVMGTDPAMAASDSGKLNVLFGADDRWHTLFSFRP